MTPAEAIRTYIRAKDENRPHLLRRAFAPTAVAEVVSHAPAMTFPPVCEGLDAITDTLIREFGRVYENVYTFCLSEPPARDCRRFACRWLVGMSERKGGAVRVGCGRYDWLFASDQAGLVARLAITIERMEIYDPSALQPVMDWVDALPYPWCPPEVAAKGAPAKLGTDRRPNPFARETALASQVRPEPGLARGSGSQ